MNKADVGISDIDPSFVTLSGWPHVKLSRDEFARLMVKDCLSLRNNGNELLPRLGFSMNGQALSLCESNKSFSDAMREADYIQADGQSLVMASTLLCKGNCLPERIATTDFFHDAAKYAIEFGLGFYLLGGSEGIINEAVKNIKKEYPDLNIVGWRNGYFSIDEEKEICEEIVLSGADVLWVGMGKPKEQLFCVRNKERLKGVAWVKTCGGLYDFLAGRNKRAPKWIQDVGLEWMHRTMSDPKRFFWRYLTTNFHSIYILLKGYFNNKCM